MASRMVNIRSDVSDAFYRYRMPLLETKIEGKGNGIKTVLPNMSDVAKALARPPSYPTKFFGNELGAQTIMDEKNDRYIVNGAHDASRVRELLVVFIDKFVLCPSCKNPETELSVKGNKGREVVTRDCKACGERSQNPPNKLDIYISKNPPEPKVKKELRKKAGAEAEDEATALAEGGDGANGDEADGDEAGSGDELTRQIVAAAKETDGAAAAAATSELAKDDWSADVSKEAVEKRMQTLQGSMNTSLVLGDDDEGEGGNSADAGQYGVFGRWLAEHRTATDAEIYQQATELGIEKKYKAVQALAQNLFTDAIVVEITARKAVLRKLITGEKHEKAFLGGIEHFVGVQNPDLVAAVPKILAAVYNADLLEDDEMLKHWASHASSKYVDKQISKQVRRAAKPFITWLEQEDEESE